MPEQHVVFYRSMNLGHRGSPDRALLETALREAGAVSVRSFQTNGTVLIDPGAVDAQEVVARAAARLRSACGYDDAAFVRPFAELAAILARKPFDGTTDARTYRETFTFFDGRGNFGASLPWTNAKGDVDILEIGDGVALGVIRKTGGTAGSPTAEIEARLGGRASTRTAGTIERLVSAAG